MTARVYVHIGPHKTGTTFLQQVMAANRALLAERGVLFPGAPYRAQRSAVLTLLRRGDGDGDPAPRDAWDELAAEVMSWTGDVAVISVENLDAAGRRTIEQLVRSLAGAEVHVVFTARDLAKVIPARWQTYMRNRDHPTWQGYLKRVRRDAERGVGLWRGQDPRVVFAQWEKFIPRDRIHVVTVPPSGSPPGILWERFCSVLGLDPAPYSLDVPRLNESLGTAETELLRQLNKRAADRISRPGYVRWVQNFIARPVLEQRPHQTRFALPSEEYGWVRAQGQEIIRFLEDGRYELTGDLQELLPRPPTTPSAAPDATDDAAVLDAAIDVIAALLVQLDERAGAQQISAIPPSSTQHQVLARIRGARAVRVLRASPVGAVIRRARGSRGHQ